MADGPTLNSAWPATLVGAAAVASPRRVEAAIVDDVASVTAAYRRAYGQLGIRTLFPLAIGQLRLLNELRQGSMLPADRRRLTKTIGESFALAGTMLLMDAGAFDTAAAHFGQALGAVQEAEDAELEGFVLGALAFTTGYAGDWQGAKRLATVARRRVRGSGTLITQGWLAAVGAEAHARVGDEVGCLRALDEAFQLTGHLDPHQLPPWIGVGAFDPAKLQGYYGLCYLLLGDPQRAADALNVALASLAPGFRKHRCTALADLATALIALDEIEEGCRVASDSLALAIDLQHEGSIDRVRSLVPALSGHANKGQASALLEQLRGAARPFPASPQ